MPTVLIADDEPHMRRLIELSLKKAGLATRSVDNGEAAVQLASEISPAAIVLDVTMPVLDGLEALRRLKSDEATRGIPVVMLTSKGFELTRDEAEISGAAAFITKPFSPRILAEEIKGLI